MSTPRVTEIPPRMARVVHDDFGDEPERSPRRPPYHRPSQRQLVLLALRAEGRFDDYHGDHKRI